ncbi:MAG: hypothetical protein PG981_001232 [Wolbachia endosymbiont of Ctenocephalides orientis wCori]|nr:MAG: hypothetical protein PG981_001232 [Wolbachia endosymbiont of Ctenocephalides orientis wCori]
MTKDILPNTTPLFFMWINRKPENLKLNQHPLPNSKKLPYHKRLEKCADLTKLNKEDREIILYFSDTGLTKEQKQMMEKLATRKNIKIINFNEKLKGKVSLKFLENDEVPLPFRVDLMRLIALCEDGPGIYFDFDILLKRHSKIGNISIPNKKVILVANEDGMGLQNSIIIVNSSNNPVLSCVADAAIRVIEDPVKLKNLAPKGCLIFHLQKFALRYLSD